MSRYYGMGKIKDEERRPQPFQIVHLIIYCTQEKTADMNIKPYTLRAASSRMAMCRYRYYVERPRLLAYRYRRLGYFSQLESIALDSLAHWSRPQCMHDIFAYLLPWPNFDVEAFAPRQLYVQQNGITADAVMLCEGCVKNSSRWGSW